MRKYLDITSRRPTVSIGAAMLAFTVTGPCAYSVSELYCRSLTRSQANFKNEINRQRIEASCLIK
jgi:hypothetical protein